MDQGRIGLAGGQGLGRNLDAVDPGVAGDQLLHALEELELHAALDQQFVEGRDDHVAHAAAHGVEDMAFVAEGEAQHPAQRGPGALAALAGHAVGIAEHIIIA